ncbi:hypothetical protein A2V71_02670 [Candidatus Berkelbacteria bacterium RBG_13_40_8]|uniref:Cob(I)yrinic acid a,c-diamide adenosyltransferase n=1 Tax=Candidatus Berkelbacteria bacterium RBG_13_40_8 TaxID=1797467 RepID=A0A1F5DNH5_9BACT|nr:MAG: hypothetical protein A2V71_02670 [Candidatus Berkelbacteria bacterium RBG_13_40_8]
MKKQGFVHLYTGNGRGKTTSALGLSLRALGAGKKVVLIQFMKKAQYSEHRAIKKYKLPIDVFAFGIGFYKILGDNKPKEAHVAAAQKGLQKAKEIIEEGKHNVIILDEVNIAVSSGLLDVNEVIKILKPKKADIILTGRHAHPKLKKLADVITLVENKKHYYDKGVKARKGIEY